VQRRTCEAKTIVILLPPTFSFSQSSLQAFEDCPRRFWLAYVEQLPWPAVEASPIQEHEATRRLGERFHRLVQRSEIGMASEQVGAALELPLAGWFDAYLAHRPPDLPNAVREIERVLSIPYRRDGDTAPETTPFRLAAKYDLIAAERNGRAVIVDWKTAKRRGDPSALRHRMQSIVYPYVLVEASAGLPWGPVRPEQVEMRYWFTAAPSQPITLRYDAAQHAANHARLQRLLDVILGSSSAAHFPKVADTPTHRRRFCAFCIYRSRCDRGAAAGDLNDLDDAEDFFAIDIEKALEFTLDDVEELAF